MMLVREYWRAGGRGNMNKHDYYHPLALIKRGDDKLVSNRPLLRDPSSSRP